MSSASRRAFWITGISLYLSVPVIELFNLNDGYTFAAILFGFPLYILIFFWYSFTETESSYWSIAVILVLGGFFAYPFICKVSENAGIYFNFKPHEVELTEFAKEINSSQNITHISRNQLNFDIFMNDMKYPESRAISKRKFDKLKSEMNRLGIAVVNNEENFVYVFMKTGAELVFVNNEKKLANLELPNKRLDLYLGSNWYKWSCN